MKKMELTQMEQIEGGRVNCSDLGKAGTVVTIMGAALGIVAFAATGPVAVAAGIMTSIWGAGDTVLGIAGGIACWGQ